MSAQTHKCACGFSWSHGFSGAHACEPYYRKQIADQHALLVRYMAAVIDAEGMSYIDPCGGHDIRLTPEEKAALRLVEVEALAVPSDRDGKQMY